jgi:hypothetical protein
LGTFETHDGCDEAETEDQDGDTGPNQGSEGQGRFIGGLQEGQFGFLVAMRAGDHHADMVGLIFQVAATMLAGAL